MAAGLHNFETTTFNQPGLAYDPITGITAPLTSGYIWVPMVLTQLDAPNMQMKENTVPLIPMTDANSGLGYGAGIILWPTRELPKMNMEGTIDTPATMSSGWRLPNVTASDGSVMDYAQLIVACLEGRAGDQGSGWSKIRPRWFRDPYGRIYGDYNNNGSVPRPQVTSFVGQYVEGVPCRVQFQLTLRVAIQ